MLNHPQDDVSAWGLTFGFQLRFDYESSKGLLGTLLQWSKEQPDYFKQKIELMKTVLLKVQSSLIVVCSLLEQKNLSLKYD